MWDPLSSSQTRKLTSLLRQLASDYPSVSSEHRNTQSLFSSVLSRLRRATQDDVLIPLYTRAQVENSLSPHAVFYNQQFWSCVKVNTLLLTICSCTLLYRTNVMLSFQNVSVKCCDSMDSDVCVLIIAHVDDYFTSQSCLRNFIVGCNCDVILLCLVARQYNRVGGACFSGRSAGTGARRSSEQVREHFVVCRMMSSFCSRYMVLSLQTCPCSNLSVIKTGAVRSDSHLHIPYLPPVSTRSYLASQSRGWQTVPR